MSLINQVLRDLDRHAWPTPALPATAGVAVIAAAPRRHSGAAVSLLIASLALAGVLRQRGDTLAARVDEPAASAKLVVHRVESAVLPAAVSASASLSPSTAARYLADHTSAPWWLTTRELPPSALPAAAPPAVADDTRADAASPRPAGDGALGLRLRFDGDRGDAWLGASTASALTTLNALSGSAAVIAPGTLSSASPGNAAPASAAPTALPASAAQPATPAGPVRIEKRAVATSAGERAEAAYRLGTEAQQRGDATEAASAYGAALQEDHRLTTARVALAGLRVAQGRSAEAEELLQAGLTAGPPQAVLAMTLGRLLAARGDLNSALDVLQNGLQGASGNAEYHATYGAVLQRTGRYRDAAEQFNAALRLVPGNGVWWMGMAMSLAADNRADAARSAYLQALKVGGLSSELERFVQQRLGSPNDARN